MFMKWSDTLKALTGPFWKPFLWEGTLSTGGWTAALKGSWSKFRFASFDLQPWKRSDLQWPPYLTTSGLTQNFLIAPALFTYQLRLKSYVYFYCYKFTFSKTQRDFRSLPSFGYSIRGTNYEHPTSEQRVAPEIRWKEASCCCRYAGKCNIRGVYLAYFFAVILFAVSLLNLRDRKNYLKFSYFGVRVDCMYTDIWRCASI